MSKNGKVTIKNGKSCWLDYKTGTIYKGLVHIRSLGMFDSFIFEGVKNQLPVQKRAGSDKFIDTGLDILELLACEDGQSLFLCQQESGARIRYYVLAVFEDDSYILSSPRPKRAQIFKESLPSMIEDLKNGNLRKENQAIIKEGERKTDEQD